jgi:predicted ATPase
MAAFSILSRCSNGGRRLAFIRSHRLRNQWARGRSGGKSCRSLSATNHPSTGRVVRVAHAHAGFVEVAGAAALLEDHCRRRRLALVQVHRPEAPLLLTRVLVRFFRSVNFDQEAKATRKKEYGWEVIEGAGWFPFVEIDIDPEITAVVGANESGKSHLIGATLRALSGERISSVDFCRYSQMYSVEVGEIRSPDFGAEFMLTSAADVDALKAAGLNLSIDDRFILLRMGSGENAIVRKGQPIHPLESDGLARVQAVLPQAYQLKTRARIPDVISFDALLGREPGLLSRRRDRFEFDESLRSGGISSWPELMSGIANLAAPSGDQGDDTDEARGESERLGCDLLLNVARISPSKFSELEAAIRDGKEGQVGALIEQMNRSIARHLNFRRWWRQDRDFELRLAPREREVAFTIRDKTGTDYSFSERSRGLTYFLGYFVQLRAHPRPAHRSEVLLMDEPDAYLSSAAQADLLRVLDEFARPANGVRRDQVIYVTHSPFLINKNAGHRIRVLDKGTDQEGTRVVRDIVRNHYEPLRTSIGAHIAETAFIGGANLLVEGPTDQILLTIVPCASASHVPYMAYLARGRDTVKPPCVALLDDDTSGCDAISKLAKGEADGKRILQDRHIINLGDWAKDADLALAAGTVVVEPEDLIPAAVAVEGARYYAHRFLGLPAENTAALQPNDVVNTLGEHRGSMFAALRAAFAAAFDGKTLQKVGFSKELVHYLERAATENPRPTGLPAFEQNFSALIRHLGDALEDAGLSESNDRDLDRVERIIRSFAHDFNDGMSRDTANRLLRDIDSVLDDSEEHDSIRQRTSAMRRLHHLTVDPLAPVEDSKLFLGSLPDLLKLPRQHFLDQLGPAQSSRGKNTTQKAGTAPRGASKASSFAERERAASDRPTP